MDLLVSARNVLRILYLEGLDVSLRDDGTPAVTGGTPSTGLQDLLREHREGVIQLLKTHNIGRIDPMLKQPRRYVTPKGCLSPNGCAVLGPCSRTLMRKPCNALEGDADEQ